MFYSVILLALVNKTVTIYIHFPQVEEPESGYF